jgi:hypothetical protein
LEPRYANSWGLLEVRTQICEQLGTIGAQICEQLGTIGAQICEQLGTVLEPRYANSWGLLERRCIEQVLWEALLSISLPAGLHTPHSRLFNTYLLQSLLCSPQHRTTHYSIVQLPTIHRNVPFKTPIQSNTNVYHSYD